MKKGDLKFLSVILTLIAIMLFVVLYAYGSRPQSNIIKKTPSQPSLGLQSIHPTSEYSFLQEPDVNDLIIIAPPKEGKFIIMSEFEILINKQLNEQRAMEQRLKVSIYLFCGICSLFLVLIFLTVKSQKVKNYKTEICSSIQKRKIK